MGCCKNKANGPQHPWFCKLINCKDLSVLVLNFVLLLKSFRHSSYLVFIFYICITPHIHFDGARYKTKENKRKLHYFFSDISLLSSCALLIIQAFLLFLYISIQPYFNNNVSSPLLFQIEEAEKPKHKRALTLSMEEEDRWVYTSNSSSSSGRKNSSGYPCMPLKNQERRKWMYIYCFDGNVFVEFFIVNISIQW